MNTPTLQATTTFKDCPFCGATQGEGTVVDHEENGYWYIVCWACSASGAGAKTLAEAVGKWNTRSDKKVGK